jgi:hypothetical protein
MVAYHRIKDVSFDSPGTDHPRLEIHRDYWVQKAPYKVPMPYTMLRRELLAYERNWFSQISYPPSVGNLVDYDFSDASREAAKASNNAYGKFQDHAKDAAQNANNLLEMKGAASQILQHVTALGKSVEAARKLDIPGMVSALGVFVPSGTKKRWKKQAKAPADLWLEYHFGWEPLVQDIGSSIDILQGTGKSSKQKRHITGHAESKSSAYASLDSDDFFHQRYDRGFNSVEYKMSTRMGANVVTTNPNVAMANQMGFVNPLSVAWEAVPFSFVVDWFGNVGQCLSAMTDSLGFDYEGGWTTTHWEKTVKHQLSRSQLPDFPGDTTFGYESWTARSIQIVRATAILGPSLSFGLPSPIGIPRAATAISLLLQQMHKL